MRWRGNVTTMTCDQLLGNPFEEEGQKQYDAVGRFRVATRCTRSTEQMAHEVGDGLRAGKCKVFVKLDKEDWLGDMCFSSLVKSISLTRAGTKKVLRRCPGRGRRCHGFGQ